MEEELTKWAETWRKAGKALDEQKLKELRDPMYYQNHVQTLNAMLCSLPKNHVRRTTGLIELQKIIKRMIE
ncbi:MAG: hypothetical protein BWY83_02062 [bacterium ADurb.Bin478]|nr:MAG: hypothetical protein BWY83_02062 [bacterium ADurb.Bin478]